jgi:homoserine O-acetyltransferase
MREWVLALTLISGLPGTDQSTLAQAPPVTARHFLELRNFSLEGGVTLPHAKLAYVTFGSLNAARSNAVLLPSAYAGDYHDYEFLIGPGRALDSAEYYLVATEMFGNGVSSSPSNTPPPFHGPRFPEITIRDDVLAAYKLLTERLGVTHLRAVVGFSMGAEQAFQWAVTHPKFVDAIVPYCGTAKIYPHGVVRLESAMSALKADPTWNEGNYTAPPVRGLRAWADHWTAWIYSQEWWRQEMFKPRFPTADSLMQYYRAQWLLADPNNLLSQALTWQRHDVGDTPGFGGDVERALRSIEARTLYMPCQTDLYFPMGDAVYESRFIHHVRLRAIPSLWGHLGGSGTDPSDALGFINAQIRDFLKSPQ